MFTTMVDKNGNVDYSAQSRSPQTQHPHMVLEEQVSKAFYEWGLVEVLLTVEDGKVWHDAYIIDVEEVPVESTKEGGTNKVLTAHTCTIVLAVDGEDPITTLSSSKNVQKCMLEQIRLKLNFDPDSNLSECDMVQVAMESSRPFICWKTAKIKMAKDNFFVIELVNSTGSESSPVTNDSLGLDIVPKERLRPLNANYQLTEENNPFYRISIKLPEDLVKFLKGDLEWLCNFDLHKDFKKYCQLISVTVDCEKKMFNCLAFSSSKQSFIKDQVIKRSQMLTSMHFNKLKDSYLFSDRTPMAQNEALNTLIPRDFILHLAINPKYIGLAIGKAGANIQKARKMAGIHSLDLDDKTLTFIIRGVSMEVCRAAAEMLNYGEEKAAYPKDYGELFQDRKLVEEIVAKSGIVKLELFTDNEKADEIELLIIGKPDSIENFKMILSYQKAEQDEINEFKYKHKILLQEIFNLQRKTGPMTGNWQCSIAHGFSMPKNFAEAVKAGIRN